MRRVIREELHDTLRTLGVKPDEAIEMQKDMAWLRTWRLAIMAGGFASLRAVLSIAVVGLISALLVGFGVPTRVLHLLGIPYP